MTEEASVVLETGGDVGNGKIDGKENSEATKKKQESDKGDDEPKTEKKNEKENKGADAEEETENKKENVIGPTPDEERGFLHYFLPSRLFA